MKVLVLGSAGQIGSALVKYLKATNHEVVEFDIADNKFEDLSQTLVGIDFVFFLAFDVGGSIYLNKYQNTYDFISNNMRIMSETFDSLKAFNIPFIFSSSQMSDLTNSSYGILKNIGEKYTFSLPKGKVVKFWNVYGHEEDLEKSHVITDFILMAKNDDHIQMRTSGTETRQFLYSKDCSECLTILMENFNKIEEKSLDVSNFKWISIFEIASIITSNFPKCTISRGSYEDNLQRKQLKDPNRTILKYWKPKTLITEGIKNIIKQYE